jgi:hypothetical protein
VSVPLPTNVRADDATQILLQAEVSCLVCSAAELPRLTPALSALTCLKAFVVMDTADSTWDAAELSQHVQKVLSHQPLFLDDTMPCALLIDSFSPILHH